MKLPAVAVNRPLAVVAVTVLAIGLLAEIGRPSAPRPRPLLAAGAAAAVRSTAYCPDVRRAAAGLSTRVVVGTTAPGAGSVLVAAAAGPATTAPVLTPGQTVGTYAGSITGPVSLTASGSAASAYTAEQISLDVRAGADRGWAEAACTPTRSEEWFVGAATGVGDAAVVELANPASMRAIASISVLTPNGVVDSEVGDNLVVPPSGGDPGAAGHPRARGDRDRRRGEHADRRRCRGGAGRPYQWKDAAGHRLGAGRRARPERDRRRAPGDGGRRPADPHAVRGEPRDVGGERPDQRDHVRRHRGTRQPGRRPGAGAVGPVAAPGSRPGGTAGHPDRDQRVDREPAGRAGYWPAS